MLKHTLASLCVIDVELQPVEMENVCATSCLESNSLQERLAALHGGNVLRIEALPRVRTRNCQRFQIILIFCKKEPEKE